MNPIPCHPLSPESREKENASGFNPGGIAYEWSAAAIVIAAAVVAAVVPVVVAIAAAEPNDNQQNDDPTAVIAAKTGIAHMGDLL